MSRNKICITEITGLEIKDGIRHSSSGNTEYNLHVEYYTKGDNTTLREIEIFKTKEELIASLDAGFYTRTSQL